MSIQYSYPRRPYNRSVSAWCRRPLLAPSLDPLCGDRRRTGTPGGGEEFQKRSLSGALGRGTDRDEEELRGLNPGPLPHPGPTAQGRTPEGGPGARHETTDDGHEGVDLLAETPVPAGDPPHPVMDGVSVDRSPLPGATRRTRPTQGPTLVVTEATPGWRGTSPAGWTSWFPLLPTPHRDRRRGSDRRGLKLVLSLHTPPYPRPLVQDLGRRGRVGRLPRNTPL